MKTVAAIIPVYNGEEFLMETISSVLSQTYQDFQLYIVDDGSTDRTPELLQTYQDDPRVTCISQRNQGQAAAINRALEIGNEPYISVIDADDLWSSNRLEKTIPILDADSSIGLVCNDFHRGENPEENWTSAWQSSGYRPRNGNAFDRLLEENFIMRNAALFRRKCIDQCGGFSEEIGGKCGSDDRDMWLKIAFEYPIYCVHGVLSFVRQHPGRDSLSTRAIESRVRLWSSWLEKMDEASDELLQVLRSNLAKAYYDLGYHLLKSRKQLRNSYMNLLRSAWLGLHPVKSLVLIVASILKIA